MSSVVLLYRTTERFIRGGVPDSMVGCSGVFGCFGEGFRGDSFSVRSCGFVVVLKPLHAVYSFHCGGLCGGVCGSCF